MPFLKCHRKYVPPSTRWEQITYKTGFRRYIYNVSGDKYIGEWKINKKDGKGTTHTRTGKLYEGDWERNYRHGFGVFSEKQSNDVFRSIYVGEWWNGRKQGKGRHYYPDGSWYDGEWKSGKRCGIGESLFADGSYYYGQWKNDTFHGYGLFILKSFMLVSEQLFAVPANDIHALMQKFLDANGNRYEGEWQNGNKHGHGKFYHLDSGQLQEGFWINNMCLCSNMKDIYYRQSALDPTKYPIPQIKLANPSGVYTTQEDCLQYKSSKQRRRRSIRMRI
ncbi:MORN repeat-containing protein 3 [Blattella germanica]|nr:MORN repeat-containing protein 3 [Blattella germanica]